MFKGPTNAKQKEEGKFQKFDNYIFFFIISLFIFRSFSRSRSRSSKQKYSSRSNSRRRHSQSPRSKEGENIRKILLNQSDIYHTFNYILDENQLEDIAKKIPEYYQRLDIQDFDTQKDIIKEFAKKILGRSKTIDDVILPETKLASDMPDRKKKAFQIMLPRLAYFGLILVTNSSSARTFGRFLVGMMELKKRNNDDSFISSHKF